MAGNRWGAGQGGSLGTLSAIRDGDVIYAFVVFAAGMPAVRRGAAAPELAFHGQVNSGL